MLSRIMPEIVARRRTGSPRRRRQIDHVGRAAGAEQRAGDAPGEPGHRGPGPAHDAGPAAPGQAPGGVGEAEGPQRAERRAAREPDQQRHPEDVAEHGERSEPRQLAPVGVAAEARPHRQRGGDVEQHGDREDERHRQEVRQDRYRDQRGPEAGAGEDQVAGRDDERPGREGLKVEGQRWATGRVRGARPRRPGPRSTRSPGRRAPTPSRPRRSRGGTSRPSRGPSACRSLAGHP